MELYATLLLELVLLHVDVGGSCKARLGHGSEERHVSLLSKLHVHTHTIAQLLPSTYLCLPIFHDSLVLRLTSIQHCAP